MPTLFTAGLATETNSFSSLPTRLADFSCIRGGVAEDASTPFEAPLAVYRRAATAAGWQVVEGLCAHATPGGPTESSAHESLRDEILGQLRAALPVDAVALNLHGSMETVGIPDSEGDLLQAVRALVGAEVPVGAVLDLHSHPTRAMVAAADVLIWYKLWPHVDSAERALELFQILEGSVSGRVVPRMAVFNTRMLGLFPTAPEPMAGLVAALSGHEAKPGVLSVSIAHDHPWTDVPELGARVVVVTDAAHEDATDEDGAIDGESLAARIGRDLYRLREQVAWRFPPLDVGLDAALAETRHPVVLLDMSDNPGGGAPGDGTQVLAELLARGVREAALCLWDPRAVRAAFEAGVGAALQLDIGGHSGPHVGRRLRLDVTVTGLVRGLEQRSLVAAGEMGDAAALACNGIDIVVTERRVPTHSPDCFEQLGINPASRRLLVAKTLNNARPGFDAVAAKYLWVDSGGACRGDVRQIRFRYHEPGLWPFEPDPLGLDAD